jgi:elongation factor G
MAMDTNGSNNICNVGIVGPYSSGKTTLMESLLSVTGAISRKGKIDEGNTIGDSAAEARSRKMSVEISTASTQEGDRQFTFIDCPGSIEFAPETEHALMGVDAAIVVCEPNIDRVLTLSPLFKFLDDWEIPHLIFINKIDRSSVNFIDLLHALQQVSSRPLIAHQYPIIDGERTLGFIDLVTEQAYHYHPGDRSDRIPFPAHLAEQEQMARSMMLEELANFDDHLLEELLSDIVPSEEEIIGDLRTELSTDSIVPVFMGVAEADFGVRTLLHALEQELPLSAITAERRGLSPSRQDEATIAQVIKTFYTPQGGKLSLLRIWQGTLIDGMNLNGVRASGVYRLFGAQQQTIPGAKAGEIVAVGRLEGIPTGAVVSDRPTQIALPKATIIDPVYALAIVPTNRNDEVKLSGALAKIMEEDPSLFWEQHGDTHEVILWGQGEIHLQVTLDRLRRKYNLPMQTHLPQVAYKETIRKPTNSVHGRYKHQSGGHGQFGDVYLDIKPSERGRGFEFHETIVGGVVPKQYIPGVETGVREFLDRGPLGFPVVDVEVTLTNGSYHTVDSSEQAFKNAARLAMTEGMSKCEPTLLEPVGLVEISAPAEFTSKVLQLVSGRRGQILGYDAKAGWLGWDVVSTNLPQAEMQSLIVELRSLTLGVGFYTWRYDKLQEVPDKLAERVLSQTNGNR